MAYLKSSQITGLSPKPIDVTGFTQADSINLGDRAYTEHEVLLADAFSVTGDVTISDNLILAKLSDDGNAITVTGNASATRTISGSGSLEGSTFAQTPNASLTGMTGVIGSGVILGSAVTGRGITSGTITGGTITSGVTFPAGHVVQVFTHVIPGTSSTTTSSSWTDVNGFPVLFTPKSESSKIIFSFSCTAMATQGWAGCHMSLYDNTAGAQIGGTTSMVRLDMQSNRSQYMYARWGTQFTVVTDSWGTTQHSLKCRYYSDNSQNGGINDDSAEWPVVIWEIMT